MKTINKKSLLDIRRETLARALKAGDKACRAAHAEYVPVLMAYRTRTIDDAGFLAARAKYDAALAAWDKADMAYRGLA